MCVCTDDRVNVIVLSVAMKKGSFVISLTKRLPSDDFTLVDHDMYRMSWGEATIFITQKHTEARELE
jgi:hypothetical protein